MTNEKKRKTKKRFNLKSWIVLALGLYMVYAILSQQPQMNNLDKSIAETKAMTQEKQQKASELDDAAQLYSSEEFVGRVARERLGLVRSDETVFVDITGK